MESKSMSYLCLYKGKNVSKEKQKESFKLFIKLNALQKPIPTEQYLYIYFITRNC